MSSTPTHSPKRRKSLRPTRRQRLWHYSFVGLAFVLALLALIATGGPSIRDVASDVAARSGLRVQNTAVKFIVPAGARPVFRYSVVPGGVYSKGDVVAAIGRDAVVASHYKSIVAAALHPVTVPANRKAFMSYRIGNQVYWTKHKMELQKGETILSDGVNDIRARCGNRISDDPMLPTSENEPDAMEFDALTAGEHDPETMVVRGVQGIMLGANGELPKSLRFPMESAPSPFLPYDVPGSIPGGVFPAPQTIADASVPGSGTPTNLGTPPIVPPPGVTNVPPGTGTPPIVVYITPNLPPGTDDPLLPPDDPGGPGDPPIPTPEPGTLLLIGGGLSTMLARRRRNGRKS